MDEGTRHLDLPKEREINNGVKATHPMGAPLCDNPS
jgi:hypothetical protein